MATNYRARKENFVSNLSGGTVWEINQVTLTMPCAIFLWSVLQSRQRFFHPYTFSAYITDILINGVAILLATTTYSKAPLLLNALILLPAFIVLLPGSPRQHEKSKYPPKHESVLEPLPIKPFVTVYRGAMLLITCISILAVDFRVFPRRFAKVETWGTSLMDVGVGSFVFVAGVVSVRSILRNQLQGREIPLGTRLRTSLRHSAPLLALGLIRLYSVKGLDYAEHVTEYGVHWNFFFTLGLLPPFVALFQSLFRYIPSYAALATLLSVAYECALRYTDLTKFIVAAPRTDLLSKNREGIFSFIGYLAIFLAGQGVGMDILRRDPPGMKRGLSKPFLLKSVLAKLCFWSIASSALYLGSSYHGLGLSVSRRLANLPYVFWITAFNSSQLAICCAIELLLFPDLHKATSSVQEKKRSEEATSKVLHAFNRNGLAIFLLANLLTGLVNLTLPTLDMSHLQAMGVLITYTFALCGVALYLDARNITIKL